MCRGTAPAAAVVTPTALSLEGVAALGQIVPLLALASRGLRELIRRKLAADGTGLLRAEVERHVLLVRVVLAELQQGKGDNG